MKTEAEIRADERERIAQAIEGRGAICRTAHGDECIGFAAYQDAASIARNEGVPA